MHFFRCVFSDMSVVELLAEDRSTTKIQFIATSDGKEKAGEEKSVLEVDEEDPTVRYGNAPPHSSSNVRRRVIRNRCTWFFCVVAGCRIAAPIHFLLFTFFQKQFYFQLISANIFKGCE